MSDAMPQLRASYPRFRREGAKPAVELTEDDAAMLRHVFRHRFVRAEDLYRLFPGRSKDRLSRRLTLLYRAGYLDRPIAQIDRFRQGGSQSFVYGLDTLGARYLKETRGVTIGGADWKSRNRSYTRENLEHTLAVSKFMIDLEIDCRARLGLSLVQFDDILAKSPEEARRAKDPMMWPVPIQWHGGRSIVHVAPDAIFALRVRMPDGTTKRANFFLEMDRGTMTVVPSERVRLGDAFPYRATILRKLYAYADSYRQKLHEARFGIKAPRVLFLTKSAVRADGMRQAAEEFVVRPMKLPAQLFTFRAVEAEPLTVLFGATQHAAATVLYSSN